MIGKLEKLAGYAVLVVASLFAIVPIIGVIIMALQPADGSAASLSLLDAHHIENFSQVWEAANFGASMRTSAILTGTTVILTVMLSVPAGYALALIQFRGAGIVFYLFLLGLLIPLEGMIVPLYFDLHSLGLANSYWAVILPNTALSLAFGIFWMRAAFLNCERTLVEAARMDGAGTLMILRRVLFPLVRPMVLTLAVLIFAWTWNDFLMPLVMLSGSDLQTAPMSLTYFQGQHMTNYAYLASAAIITALPVVVIYLLAQRAFVRGIMSGALKG
ncbi:carbohydrate ABC transporter permease [Rhizobium miluonense]|uniref:Raffinose/stachyose/melibiose transport system permease protein n=1 Tax=Rhizobium miluonense TaxID=411945 RepID=A0A1C3V705_9HYPH|nr:carbohydrate ABC transporter permease [Rhizobium miluonense]SCB23542.1 raffinose/stachyose/melibiose transport system permease protein [Rhizobium miluonense]